MFDFEGNLVTDEGAAEVVTKIVNEVESEELTSELLRKCRKALRTRILPNMEEITRKVVDKVHQMDIKDDDIQPLGFESSGDLEEELQVYIIAWMENVVEQYWKMDLHRMLDLTLNAMLEGGLIQSISAAEKTPDIYDKWKNELSKSLSNLTDRRKELYDKAYEIIMNTFANEAEIIDKIVDDPRVVGMVVNADKDKVEIQIARN